MKQKASSKNKSNKLKQKPSNGVVGKSKEFKLSRKWKRKFLIGTWLVVFSPFISIAILMFTIPAEELPDYALLENPVSNQASTLYADGEKVLGTFFVDNRSNVAYQELSINLVNALIATEDERYYKHSGVDTWGLIRAISGQLLGQNKGGGSTITQQLAKMMFHEMPSRDKWARVNEKLAEWVIAARLERRYTKKEIIAMYFNQFDFLYNAVGIKSAARIYYNTTPKELTISEAATLVGMAKSPVIYNPKMNPKNALRRRNTVLQQMAKNGLLEKTKLEDLKKEPIIIDYRPETQNTGVGAYFRGYVKKEVQRILKKNGTLDPAGNPYNIYRDGLKIFTSLDYELQKHAEAAVDKHLGTYLQPAFQKDNLSKKHSPYGDETTREQRDRNIRKAIEKTPRYKQLKKQGISEKEIDKVFRKKICHSNYCKNRIYDNLCIIYAY